MNLQDGVSILEGLLVILFSMGIVLTILLVIFFILSVFKKRFHKYKAKKNNVKKEAPSIEDNTVVEDKKVLVDDEELVAVIAVAISAHIGNDVEKLNIRNIRRIPQISPTWMKVGRERAVYNKIKKN